MGTSTKSEALWPKVPVSYPVSRSVLCSCVSLEVIFEVIELYLDESHDDCNLPDRVGGKFFSFHVEGRPQTVEHFFPQHL